MQIIPLRALPAQVFTLALSNQTTKINLYQKLTGLYVDVYVNDALVIGGAICQNKNRIVRSEYLGFVGDLAFLDTQGDEDPVYTGLGDRYVLAYLEVDDLDVLDLPS